MLVAESSQEVTGKLLLSFEFSPTDPKDLFREMEGTYYAPAASTRIFGIPLEEAVSCLLLLQEREFDGNLLGGET